MDPNRYHSLPQVGAFPGEAMHHQFYPTSPQPNPYVPHPSHQHPGSPLGYMGQEHSYTGQEQSYLMEQEHSYTGQEQSYLMGQEHSYTGQEQSYLMGQEHSYTGQEQRHTMGQEQRHSQLLPAHAPLSPCSPTRWECLQCSQKFFSEAERDQHLYQCLQPEPPAVPEEPLYESIDSQAPVVLLVWTKEKQTLETEVQLFTKAGEAVTLRWCDQERRFQAEARLSAGPQDGLLSVNDINLSAEVHSFYVAETKINAKMQIIELAINDEAEELKKREEPVAVEQVAGKAEAETPKKSKSRDLKKKLSKAVDNNQEGDWNAREGDAKKQIKSLQKENDKHSQKEGELREQNKKLSADCSKYRKQAETLGREREAKRQQLEGEKLALMKTVTALKRESEQRKASAERPDGELSAALGRSKSQLSLRDKENTDLSQQLATLQLITSVQENQLKDQEEEIVERRERVSQLEAELRGAREELAGREGAWQLATGQLEDRLRESSAKSELELDQLKKELEKSQIIRESLKERISTAAQLERAPEAVAERTQVRLAPPDGGEETEARALRGQLRAVEKERDELVLVKKACELDLERLKERSKLGGETKSEQRAPPDPEISKFFQSTIKRKEEELEESRQNMAALREQNLRLRRETEACQQQLEGYREVIVPGLKRQIQELEDNQLTAVGLSDVDGSLTCSFEEAQLVSPVGPDQLLEPPAVPGVSNQELPLPLHLQKQQSLSKYFSN